MKDHNRSYPEGALNKEEEEEVVYVTQRFPQSLFPMTQILQVFSPDYAFKNF